MPIFTDGREQAVVVLPDNSTQVTTYAGKELVHYLNAATQGDFRLKKESELLPNDGPYRIYIGASKAAAAKGISINRLKKNHYVVFPAKEALYLIGRDEVGAEAPIDDGAEMGSLLAVYDWLDRTVGVRWFWPGDLGTEIPRHTELGTQEGEPVYGKPALEYSRLRYYPTLYNRKRPSAYGRSNSRDDMGYLRTNEWFRRHKIYRTSGERAFYGHAFGDFWNRFGKEHPEYFALRPDGKRGPIDQRTYLTQLCVSNPELHRTIIAEWLRTRTEETPWINACENDRRTIDPSCSCDNCKAWDVPEAKVSVQNNPWHIESRSPEKIDPYEKISRTDRYMRFLLALLEEGKKHDPNAKVVGYAYSFYSDPPARIKLNKDVVIIVVPPYLYPLEKGKEGVVRKLWNDWRSTGATLFYRPNDFLAGHPVPYIFASQFGTDFKHFLDTGVQSAMFDSFTGLWGTQGINLYMLGRLQSRPDLSPDEVMNEYCSAFGPASAIIRAYIKHWEEVTAKCTLAFQDEVKGGYNYMMVAPQRIYTPDDYAEGKRLLAQAAAAAKDNDVSTGRIEYLRTWLEHAEITTQAVAAYRTLNANSAPEERARFGSMLKKVREFRKQNEQAFIGADWSFIAQVEPWNNWKD